MRYLKIPVELIGRHDTDNNETTVGCDLPEHHLFTVRLMEQSESLILH